MCHLAKQGKFVELISPAKGYFRETYKSQNINLISPTPKFTLGTISYLTFQPGPEVRGECKVKVFLLC